MVSGTSFLPLIIILTIIALANPATASCAHGTTLHPFSVQRRNAEGGAEGNTTVKINTFSYQDPTGPTLWFNLDPANTLCAVGRNQSPQVVTDANTRVLESQVVLELAAVQQAEFENAGTNVEVKVKGSFTAEGKKYEVEQFHFHTPSEHRIGNEYAAMEIHIVGQNAEDKSLAVNALFLNLVSDTPTDPVVLEVMKSVGNIATPGTRTTTGALDFAAWGRMVAAGPIRTYSGSLTTPPCSEGVTWYISTTPIPIDIATFTAAKSVIKYNSRGAQGPLGQVNSLHNISMALMTSALKTMTPGAGGEGGQAPFQAGVEGKAAVKEGEGQGVGAHMGAEEAAAGLRNETMAAVVGEGEVAVGEGEGEAEGGETEGAEVEDGEEEEEPEAVGAEAVRSDEQGGVVEFKRSGVRIARDWS